MPRKPKKSRVKNLKKDGGNLQNDNDIEMQDTNSASQSQSRPKVWQPGVDDLEEGEELQFDPSAYDCLHDFRLLWPSLSFDIVRDSLGNQRTEFPLSSYIVAGSQADAPGSNFVAIMRLSNITKMRQNKKSMDDSDEIESESDNEEDEDEEGDEDEEEITHSAPKRPKMQIQMISHYGGVNRVRSMPQKPNICSTWNDSGHVQIWDFGTQLKAMAEDGMYGVPKKQQQSHSTTKQTPLQIFNGHKEEGYAMDWSPVKEGRLLTGDCKGSIHLWEPSESSKWVVNTSPFLGHKSSVEDIQWSPTEADVFATASVDCHISIWDARISAKPALSLKAHESDINVISWNRLASCMLSSGCDDGTFRIWDLRSFQADSFIAHFNYHRSPITSIEWSYEESSTLATSSSDNTLTIWDLSLERDAEEEAQYLAEAQKNQAEPPVDIPPQLLFVHQGQNDIKELHWHPQVKSLIFSTALDGFNVFRPSNL